MKKTIHIVNKLATDLTAFYIDKKNIFMCPSCFNEFNFNDRKNITAAHIIPNVSGGKEITVLCKKCNSKFGTKQDKWFGEYLNVYLNETATILAAKTKGKYLKVNGIKVRGEIDQATDGAIEVKIYEKYNQPGILNQIKLGPIRNIETSISLADKDLEIQVGFLTAAYLMWFKEFGYSWAFQDQLSIVRQQMHNPEQLIIKKSFLIDIQDSLSPSIGILEVDNTAFPCASIFDQLVVFPNAKKESTYEQVADSLNNSKTRRFNTIQIFPEHQHPSSMNLLFKETLLMMPEHVKRGILSPENMLYFSSIDRPAEWLHPISNKDDNY
ncbi:hypothetical protein GCM10008107_20420 [Psychrosphaera saromensis]|uniref:HNH endonuclease 5 domain-containing protein n=1 Tax=Psychrosphaera saromensis TaxID=716813 RepID=A0A2S7UTY4_9GAMM|nr:HNH endonuclease [Psychrosphaera saromensis]PQJ52741.1 hypothetical protein BTO11_03095 [Psychrosphaera saromensis]GHB70875.1 hypothetical protein GCM10008107_20420 [Psychrosphaera saromensis]GLQ13228.1 hypothetical protein GCM10007917_06830 [Psychrosphaera saromensis]